MSAEARPKMPRAQIVYGEIVYWITIVACIICMIGPLISLASPDNNVLNPHYLFASIFQGQSAETVWQEVGGEFPGGHFYLKNLTKGDGFTQFGLALGCSVAFWGLLASAFSFLREKSYLFIILSLFVACLIFVSMTGLVNMGH